ncbi:complex I NDUFA9 subunit family protein [Profundibacterium mesophilum]|uniref:NADH dehydrogenase n=1 Tax=Profundibacterium mesophilum KAUST100406-0324 TaxID=1037889 RepID=A0A921NUU4_9RHOB|nr:complex I NDUFA9 subunit family protein [Profundibacterium mesophilum]KAF0675910.1 NADH dehydrogenase [Profundibacterium mesophilum KAUST100406-0324]
MSKLVTIYGGSGFLGRNIARRMARAGWRVRVAVRRPNDAQFVRTYGVVGQVEPILCNIRDTASVRAAMRGADAVVNCVGILAEGGKQGFEAVQREGAARVAELAAELGIGRLVQISAIGADEQSDSAYARSKAQGEKAVLEAFPDAVILRPSIIFGPGDSFFNRFGAMSRTMPIIPLVGAQTRFQPVFVDDVAAAAETALRDSSVSGVYELGGPEVDTFRGLMRRMLAVTGRRRAVIGLPFWLGGIMGASFDLLKTLSGGLIAGPITRDQVRNLRRDNVVSPGARGLEDLGITPMAMGAILPEYLWRFRRDGQYADIMKSAKNLRGE